MKNEELNRNILRWGNSITKYLEHSRERKIIIYGEDLYTLSIARTTRSLGYEVICVLSESLPETTDIKIQRLEQLQKFNSEQYFILVATLINHKSAYENLTHHNYTFNQDFSIMGIGGYTKPIDAIDSLLGFSRLCDDIPGFKVFKNSEENAIRIVVLGNSTSDPTTGMLESWSENLYNKLCDSNITVNIYNGATTGYCATQEFLKFNRDVLNLKPDIVISFGGYNDINGTSSVEDYPYLHKYAKKFYDFLKTNPRLAPDSMYMRNVSLISHGSPSILSDYEIWIENMKKMNAICQIYNIDFIAYFQPMLETEKCEIDLLLDKIINQFYEQSNMCRSDVRKNNTIYAQKVKAQIIQYPFIRDLTGLFENQSDVFYDICHYTEKGNRIISERIFEDINKIIFKRGGSYHEKTN